MKWVSIQRISTDSDGHQVDGNSEAKHLQSISPDGKYVAFASYSPDFVAGDTNGQKDIFRKVLLTGEGELNGPAEVIRVSVSTTGLQSNGIDEDPCMTGNNNYVFFCSLTNNFFPNDTNKSWDVFRHNVATGATELVSVGAAGEIGNGHSQNIFRPCTSADGNLIAFQSLASNFVPGGGDTNGAFDIFVKNMTTGSLQRVSTTATGAQANGQSIEATMSQDGRYVAFESDATNLVAGDTNGTRDVFVKDLLTGKIVCASTTTSGVLGNGFSHYPVLSPNGRFVGFESDATNFATGDTNGLRDVFVKDLVTGEMTLLTKSYLGGPALGGVSLKFVCNEDGRIVAIHSRATNLVPGDTNGKQDLFVIDRLTGEVMLISRNAAGVQANGDNWRPTISADGHRISFESAATNLVSGDTNGDWDGFVVTIDFDESRVTGTAGDNTLNGTPYADIIDGLGGNDRLNGDWGNDAINGGAGADVLIDGHGLDTLTGGDGGDLFQLTPDDLRLDVIADFSGAAGDRVDLTAYGSGVTYGYDAATDILTVNGAAAAKVGGDFNTGYIIVAGGGGSGVTLPGTAGADSYTGTAYNDSLTGLGGNDTLIGLAGKDTLKGGGGNDNLYGGEGDDFLSGNGGYDRIADGTGLDFLYGGTEGDTFVMTRGDAALDVIWDFAGGTGALADRVDLTDFGSGATVGFNDATDVLTVNGEAVVRIVGTFSLATDVILA